MNELIQGQVDFKLSSSNVKTLYNLINSLSQIKKEVNFKVNKDCIEVVEINDEDTILTTLKLFNSGFEEYYANKTLNFSVYLDGLKDILRTFKKADYLKMYLDLTTNRLFIKKCNKQTTTFSLSLTDYETTTKEPSLTFKTKINLSSKELYKAVKDLDKHSIVNMITNNNKFILKTDNTEIPMDTDTDSSSNSKYKTEHLYKTITNKFSDFVTLRFSSDYPLKVTYETNKYVLSYLIVPRVS